MALEKARTTGADLVMATDPDADRVGIAVRNTEGELVLLNGNQTGSLLIHYMLEAWEKAGKIKGNEYIVKTVVTSYIIDRIAEDKGVECFNTLTGFKYIGELMTKLEGEKQFIAGGEESYGYLVGEHVRDKDAVVSCAMIAEMAAYYKDQGSSLYEAMLDMYVEYGLFREDLKSVYKKGKSGAEEIKTMMMNFRANPPKKLAGSQVVTIKDYQSSKEKNIATGDVMDINLPKSNVLQFITEDGSIVSVRPSGTEPKIKFYCSVNVNLMSADDYGPAVATLDKKIDVMIETLSA
jgi:phosphoglucomutase